MKRGPRIRGEAGVALVVTLMMMSVLTMMVVGLAGVMRNEQAAARNLTYLVLAEQMAEIGAREAMAAVLRNSPTNGAPSATGPGWTLTNGVLVPLFSSNASTPTINLEAIGNNSLILSQTNAVTTILAHWLNVGTNTNLPVGRYAWWVDDEGTKADLNAAAQRNTNLFPLTTAWPFTTRQIFGVNLTDFNNRTNFLHTTESVKEIPNIGMTRFPAAKGQATVWSRTLDLNPWGQPKVPLSRLTNPAVVTINATFASLMTETFAHPQLTTLFGRDYVDKYGNGNRTLGSNVIRQILANAYEALQPSNSTARFLGDGAGTNRPTSFLAVSPRMAHLNEIPVAVTYNLAPTNASNDPNSLQLQVWVLPELIGPALLPTTGTGLDTRLLGMVMQMGDISFRCDTPETLGGTTTNLVTRTKSGFWDAANTNSTVINGTLTNATTRLGGGTAPANLTAGFYTNRTWALFEYTFRHADPNNPTAALINAGYATNLQVTVQLGRIELFQKFQATTNVMMVDWLDPLAGGQGLLFSGTNVRTNSRISAASFGNLTTPAKSMAASVAPTTVVLPSGLNYLGFSKTDPRGRAFSDWASGLVWSNLLWQQVPGSPGLENNNVSAVAWSNLPADIFNRTSAVQTLSATNHGRVWFPTTNWFFTNPALVSSWGSSGTNFPSVAALGNLQSGIPWRTMRLTAMQGDPNPPDWFLYELFTASTNPTAPGPRINVNNRILHAGGWGSAKAPMVLALLANLTNGTGTIPTNILALNPRWTTTNLNTVSSNLLLRPLPWVTDSTWGSTRTGTLGLADINVILFSSELAEVDGLGNAGTSDQQAESVMTAAMDLLTTRSDTFTVWSAGQGLVVFTNSLGQVRTNVMGEVRKQTVFQRSPATNNDGSWQTNSQGQVTNWQVKVLYTKNHVVE